MLGNAGFDIVQELDLTGFVETDLRRGLLVGNTRALWPIFLANLLSSANPLDDYTEAVIARAYPDAPVWFAHRQYNGAYLPFQRIAVAAGLGALAPTQLVIHPVYGPWFGLRALIALPGDPPVMKPLAYTCTGDCTARMATALESTDWRAWLAVRDACCVGREYRYSDDQLAYHYTKDPSLLHRVGSVDGRGA